MELPLWAGAGKLGDPKWLSVREGGGGLALRLGIPVSPPKPTILVDPKEDSACGVAENSWSSSVYRDALSLWLGASEEATPTDLKLGSRLTELAWQVNIEILPMPLTKRVQEVGN
jgi:hypothetical protein